MGCASFVESRNRTFSVRLELSKALTRERARVQGCLMGKWSVRGGAAVSRALWLPPGLTEATETFQAFFVQSKVR